MKKPGPDPGSYSPDMHVPSPKFAFPRAHKGCSYLRRSESPGPATYDTSARKSGTPSFSMGSKCQLRSRSVSPGPGAYRVAARVNSPNWRFGSSQRIAIESGNEVPGPGEYQVGEIVKTMGPSFSIKSRTRLAGESATLGFPGPASYGGLYTQFA